MRRKILILLFLSFVFPAFKVFAEVAYIKPSKLAEQSDLIIIGTVGEIQKTNETKKDTFGRDVFVKEAKVSVEDTLKGKPIPVIIVKFAYKDGEADVQDANLEEEKGKKVLLYLKLNSDPIGSYSIVSGWSGVVRFYDGKYYHQYWEVNFIEYLNKLKDFLKAESAH